MRWPLRGGGGKAMTDARAACARQRAIIPSAPAAPPIPTGLACRDHDAGFSCTMGASTDSAMTSTHPPVPRVRFAACIDVKASLGECPVWSVSEQALYWVDINAPSLNRFDPASGGHTRDADAGVDRLLCVSCRRRLRRRAARRLLARRPRRHAHAQDRRRPLRPVAQPLQRRPLRPAGPVLGGLHEREARRQHRGAGAPRPGLPRHARD